MINNYADSVMKEGQINKQLDFDYDKDFVPSNEYLSGMPDLQNTLQGIRPIAIQRVGISNFRLPLRYKTKEGGEREIETSVTGTVSLDAATKGINMSRILRSFYEYKDSLFSLDLLKVVLNDYKNKLNSFDAQIALKISYPIIQKSLRSGLEGYQYYDVVLESYIDKDKLTNLMHFDFVYSSACPCSYELSEYARETRNKATVSHSQRSVARISVEIPDGQFLWIEDIKEICERALNTETQVMVKREDEMAFAEKNGSYLKFVEDAARLICDELESFVFGTRIINLSTHTQEFVNIGFKNFKIVCSHNESLHSHDAIAVIVKGNLFDSHTTNAEFRSLIK